MTGAGEPMSVDEVADEGATERDRQHLQSAADAEEGYVDHGSRRAHQRHLVVVSLAIDVQRRGGIAAVEAGVHVAASGEHQCVDEVEQVDGVAGRQDHRAAPGGGDRSAYARGVPVTSSSTCGRGTA